MSTHKYQSISKPPSTSMRNQGGVNEIPRDHQDGSEEDVPLPSQQGFVVIDQQDESDEGLSSGDEDAEAQMQNGGYQLLAQDPDGIDDNENEPEMPSTAESSSSAPQAQSASSYDTETLQQVSSSSQSSASSAHPHLPQHLATLMPNQSPHPDQASRVSYSDTTDVREERKQKMAEDDKIKAAMAGFKLPTAGMPQWANFVSEQDWKKNLGSKLGDGKSTRQSGNNHAGGKDGSTNSPEHSADR